MTVIVLTITNVKAQLGFCNGNSGEPIFTETFGSGTDRGPALPTSTTSYSYVTGTPSDGSYTISNFTGYYNWHNTTDHTPNDTNGKSFIVNASFTADEFYQKTVTGLCENTSYEFTSWMINLLPASGCSNNGIPINVKFQIWDDTNTNLLAAGDTGNINGTSSPIWKQYGLVFKTLPNQTSVILKMINNGDGGCGNDLAIDDIVFKSCGDFISITDNQNQTFLTSCKSEGAVATTLLAKPDFSIFTTHTYQWQESLNATDWNDITGANSDSYSVSMLTTSTYYRVIIAEDAINLTNPFCTVLSEVYDITIVPIPNPPISNGTVVRCANESTPLTVSTSNALEVNWFDSPTGGMLLQTDSSTFSPTAAGIYYAEATSRLVDCPSTTRTPVLLVVNELPVVNNENLSLCEGQKIRLSTGIDLMTYAWSTGETSKEIETGIAGTYTVSVTNNNGCTAVKTIELKQLDTPIIEKITSNYIDIIITTSNEGEFEYALNNGNYQDSPIFENVEGGLYTIKSRHKNNCTVVNTDFIHLVIPKFFTPNGDQRNDIFNPQGIELFDSYEISIFDRFGNLIKNSTNNQIQWDGTFKSFKLPATDYWYKIIINGVQHKGHFALKR